MEYQPKTGERCYCKPGVARDNCPHCEGTGWRIDFRAIRERNPIDYHQTKIARSTINMPDALLGVMGGPSKKEAKEYLKNRGYSQYPSLIPLINPVEQWQRLSLEAKLAQGNRHTRRKNAVLKSK